MKYAVIRLGGHQHKIAEGTEITVDRLHGDINPEVLLLVDESRVKVGKPVLKDVKVILKTLGDLKGPKLDVFKYKAKSRYRKHIGFRPHLTKILVEKLA
ncbi:MAG: 50S ribosomal protein L21 [Candidatus Woesebacteria bacterium GW2011_GWB1_38_5b]|uniref:Large ribosomal subunit protein bL21 n=1 Tax=Candidatus Woesebacteria bacterium GW2011_GWB1_38_5b TaxID=1618569 RepID=A0A0G0K8F9_9BACT|nr:MAG: 50S ribosomal protein L21 [Candidatus Woesebacteria bacterium GW2011_GWB1_38_5b]